MNEFGQLLRICRRKSRDPDDGSTLTQARVVALLETWADLPGYPDNAMSYWENGHRAIAHTERNLLIGLILVLQRCGGIATSADANALLQAGKYSDMDEAEIRRVNPTWVTPGSPALPAAPGTPHKEAMPPPALPPVDDALFSPFVVGPAVTNPRQFFGRERELRRLFNLWKTRPLEHVALIGPKRSGKSSLLHYVKAITRTPADQLRPDQRTDWLPQPERYRWITVDFQDARMSSLDRLLRHLLTALQLPIPEPCTLESFMDTVSYQLQTPTVILMDEIEAALAAPELDFAFWENLRAWVNGYANGNLGLVFTAHTSPAAAARETGKSSPLFNIFHTLKIGPLQEAEARSLIASSPQPFAEADVTWLLAQSGLWPSLLQMLCKTRLLALEEGQRGDEWQAEGLQAIEPFRYLLA